MKILNRIKSLLISKVNKFSYGIEYSFIAANDFVPLVCKACKVCVRGESPKLLKDQLEFIKRVVLQGHESVLEHSNLVCAVVFDKNIPIYDLEEFTSVLHYLNFHTYEICDRECLIIGGSIRGYKHILRNIKAQDNIFVEYIKTIIYENTPKEFYEDLIKDGILDESRFVDWVNIPDMYTNDNPIAGSENDKSDSKVQISDIYSKALNNVPAMNKKITYFFKCAFGQNMTIPLRDLLDFCTFTVLFKKLSRTASHQLVRHRNAISQESQRYVDYSDASFINPLKEEKLPNEAYDFDFKKNATLDDIAEFETSLYVKLREHGMSKQNARSILPSNVCTRLYMTFTYTNLIKFLQLRTAKGAQSEIRNLANELKAKFEFFSGLINTDYYKYIEPYYKLNSDEKYKDIDEAVEPTIKTEEAHTEQSPSIDMLNVSDENIKNLVDISEKESVDESPKVDMEVNTYSDLVDNYESTAFNDKTARVVEDNTYYICKNGVWLRAIR